MKKKYLCFFYFIKFICLLKFFRFLVIVFKCLFVVLNDCWRCDEIFFIILYLLFERFLYIFFVIFLLNDWELIFCIGKCGIKVGVMVVIIDNGNKIINKNGVKNILIVILIIFWIVFIWILNVICFINLV